MCRGIVGDVNLDYSMITQLAYEEFEVSNYRFAIFEV